MMTRPRTCILKDRSSWNRIISTYSSLIPDFDISKPLTHIVRDFVFDLVRWFSSSRSVISEIGNTITYSFNRYCSFSINLWHSHSRQNSIGMIFPVLTFVIVENIW